MYISGLPQSLPNADQCRSKLQYWSQCRSIPIIADQFLSIPINFDQCRHWSEFRGIDRQWSAMISNGRHFGSMPRFWPGILGIDRGSPDIFKQHADSFGKNVDVDQVCFAFFVLHFALFSAWPHDSSNLQRTYLNLKWNTAVMRSGLQ